MEELDKNLKDYVSTQNEKFYLYLIRCEVVLEFDNNFTTNIETNYFYNADISNIKKSLLYDIYYFTARGYTFCNINQLTIKTISDRCNMTYENYINQPMSMCERKINMNIAKNPQLINSLDRHKNHPLKIKNSHIPFNI